MRKDRKIKIITALLTILVILFIISTAYTMFNIANRGINENSTPIKDWLENIEVYVEKTEDGKKKTKRQLQLNKLKKENEDIIAWLEIKDTNISYPVVQGKNNDYYVAHNYMKKKSKDGALFLDASYDLEAPTTNLLIYGHNNQNGKMFSTLEKYKEKAYYIKHPTIRYTTFKEDAEYEVIAVFYSKVYYQNENDVFKYYFYINIENEDEYNYYINNCKKESIYDTGKTAKYGDNLLTLSTCSYYTKNGRFVVVARKTDTN